MSAYQVLASEVIAEWRGGVTPDARQVIADHPDLNLDKSAVLQLAYEEFCLRTQAGEKLDSADFCSGFHRYKTSLARLLEVHDYFADHPDFRNRDLETPWPDVGDSFLGFFIVRELGRGGIGRVYLAREEALGKRIVAIKVSKFGYQEADTLGKLEHPHIVPVHSVQHDPDSGLTVVCMPFLGQTTLCDVLDRAFEAGRLPTDSRVILEATANDPSLNQLQENFGSLPRDYGDAIVELAIQLARALVYTHSQNIIHGDLKPSNILVVAGQLMLLDFNLSMCAMSDDRPLGGTLPYMAPEQIMAVFFSEHDRDAVVDARSDIYAMGVILYELLTGHRPFDLGKVTEVTPALAENLLDQIARGPTSIRDKNPNVDSRLATTVYRCLANSPQERFSSADELLGALRNLRTYPYRLSKWIKRHTTNIALAGFGIIMLVAWFVSYLIHRPPPTLRDYQAGMSDYTRGGYVAAAQAFDSVLVADPTSATARFARAQTSIHLDDIDAAIQDLNKLRKVLTDARITACLAYCYARQQNHPNAILTGQEAIATGFATSAVYNNLGFSYFEQGRYHSAHECFDKAIELAPESSIAYHNRIRLGIQLAMRDGVLPANIFSDIETAISLDSANPRLLLDIARVYAIASKRDSTLSAKVLEYLTRAIDLGLEPSALGADPLFNRYQNDPSFQALLRSKPKKTNSGRLNLLVIPYDAAELNGPFAVQV